MNSFRHSILFLASVGYLNYLPYKIVPFKKWKGGGLLGSLAGWALLWRLPSQGAVFWSVSIAIILGSIFVSHAAEKFLGHHDDPRIILDELAGVWVAGMLIPRTLAPMLSILFFFRLFDVFKGPWGNWVSRLPGGWGVVADDLLAGFIANLITRGIFLVGAIP